MPKQSLNWDQMYRALVAYHKKHRHCNVPANWSENPQLGRWVAMIRYRRKVEGIPKGQVDRLNAIGFVWSPSDEAWNRMCRELAAFRKEFGHTNVSAQWKRNPHLANWVANQRHRRKTGCLSKERVERLDEIGFEWSIYGRGIKRPRKVTTATKAEVTAPVEERLYCLSSGVYIQVDPQGEEPPELRKFVKAHTGEYPPYIPLPVTPVSFHIGENPVIRYRKVPWPGKGRLPRPVMDYVRDNGVLPPYD